MADKNLPIPDDVEEVNEVEEENPIVDDGGEPEGMAAPTKTAEEIQAEIDKVRQECQNDKLKFILSQDSVSDVCIAKQVKKVMQVPKMCVDFDGEAEDELCRYTFTTGDGIEYTEDGVQITGKSAMGINPPVSLRGQSFEIEMEFRVDKVQPANWVLGDIAEDSKKGSALHMGFRSNDQFSIDFYHDMLNIKMPQVAGQWIKAIFKFNASTKVGTLAVNGKIAKKKFASAYDDNISFIGRGNRGDVSNITVKRICVK
jgi:hypothetical protein